MFTCLRTPFRVCPLGNFLHEASYTYSKHALCEVCSDVARHGLGGGGLNPVQNWR